MRTAGSDVASVPHRHHLPRATLGLVSACENGLRTQIDRLDPPASVKAPLDESAFTVLMSFFPLFEEDSARHESAQQQNHSMVLR